MENTSVILTDLFCNKTKLSRDYIAIWYKAGIISEIQLPYGNKLHTNTHIDDQMYGKMELKPLWYVPLMKNDRPEEELDLAKPQLTPLLVLHKFITSTSNQISTNI